jgi:hypothetical protein
MKEYRSKQYDQFLKFNKGKRMAFLESEAEAGKFIEEFMLFFAGSSGLLALSFPGEEGESLLQENLDFMLRFWKREGYF